MALYYPRLTSSGFSLHTPIMRDRERIPKQKQRESVHDIFGIAIIVQYHLLISTPKENCDIQRRQGNLNVRLHRFQYAFLQTSPGSASPQCHYSLYRRSMVMYRVHCENSETRFVFGCFARIYDHYLSSSLVNVTVVRSLFIPKNFLRKLNI